MSTPLLLGPLLGQCGDQQPQSHRKPHQVNADLADAFVGYAARRASLAIIDVFVPRMAVHGLRPLTFTLLVLIGSNPGITSSELCTFLGIQSSNLVGLVKQLLERDLTRRKPHPQDGRANGLHLTPAGRALLKAALHSATQADQDATGQLSPEERQELLRLLRKVYA